MIRLSYLQLRVPLARCAPPQLDRLLRDAVVRDAAVHDAAVHDAVRDAAVHVALRDAVVHVALLVLPGHPEGELPWQAGWGGVRRGEAGAGRDRGGVVGRGGAGGEGRGH